MKRLPPTPQQAILKTKRERDYYGVKEQMDRQIGIIGTGSMGGMLIRSFIRGRAGQQFRSSYVPQHGLHGTEWRLIIIRETDISRL